MRIYWLLLALFLAGCDDWDLDDVLGPFRQDFQFSYPLSAGGTVQLENFNGSVEISGWDQNTVEIHGTKYAGTEWRLKETKIDVASSPNSVVIRTVPPLNRMGRFGARYVIHVPRHAELASIVSSNGVIRVDTIDGRAFLKTSNGGIHASQIHGFLDIETSNGSVDLTDVTGDTTIRTSNGAIHAEVRKGSLRARTSNGGIDVRVREPDAKPVHLESSNGHIELTMDAARPVYAGTSNSSITVRLPDSAGVTVRAQTSNASITSDFDVSVHGGTLSKHHMEGAIGAGGPLLDLTTSNGGIRLVRL